ncbi:hypothetical protein Ccrd_009876 [Cynara cardunculus var. scolymus]|uniref:Uncharacterized protein n=1 Tax=Cynara cardunculus var. scolymus TaxID=59895 RepID=A0A103YMF4_CYNCS|nr:hypothetical protein Ccrd_009876 [Cynara cardunculus var. scolymus]
MKKKKKERKRNLMTEMETATEIRENTVGSEEIRPAGRPETATGRATGDGNRKSDDRGGGRRRPTIVGATFERIEGRRILGEHQAFFRKFVENQRFWGERKSSSLRYHLSMRMVVDCEFRVKIKVVQAMDELMQTMPGTT